MPLLKPDPTFSPSPLMATQSPPEKLAYVALINPLKEGRTHAIGVVDGAPDSVGYGRRLVKRICRTPAMNCITLARRRSPFQNDFTNDSIPPKDAAPPSRAKWTRDAGLARNARFYGTSGGRQRRGPWLDDTTRRPAPWR